MLVHQTALRNRAIFVGPFSEEAVAVRPVLHSSIPHEQGVAAGTCNRKPFQAHYLQDIPTEHIV